MASYLVHSTVFIQAFDTNEECRWFVEAADEDVELVALRDAFDGFMVEALRHDENNLALLEEAYHSLKRKGEADASFTIVQGEEFSLCYIEDGGMRIARKEEDNDCYCAVWVKLWERPDNRYNQLLAMSKERLADLVCRLEEVYDRVDDGCDEGEGTGHE
jgi:hypothetical protein